MNHCINWLSSSDKEYINVYNSFKRDWLKGECPTNVDIGKIDFKPEKLFLFTQYAREKGNVASLYHGTLRLCNMDSCCMSKDCRSCRIARKGFDIKYFGSNTGKGNYKGFGKGIYFSKVSSKAGDRFYGNTVFLCEVSLGILYQASTDMPHLKCAPESCDSVEGNKGTHERLNYHEVCVYSNYAAIPRYVIKLPM